LFWLGGVLLLFLEVWGNRHGDNILLYLYLTFTSILHWVVGLASFNGPCRDRFLFLVGATPFAHMVACAIDAPGCWALFGLPSVAILVAGQFEVRAIRAATAPAVDEVSRP
jgi:hypothetical protein